MMSQYEGSPPGEADVEQTNAEEALRKTKRDPARRMGH